ncbi:sn-glycerol-3-phosphate ABC transporter ATP-binding protein UgpC [Corynebacterium incognita]|uniref:Trehalose import ATP-binding protein SugC n=1 Tax=Corynebacterium incognita TaxID=2754725 RepID=A0A7G7CR22_9CORY|nr:sn-glycerol-3-phosphate ABC transporter ATP-binding protein UgpC [Corynebacterium incognita]QNE90038.1 sn-glycerol-3-phosphate ABC transporter ATP-binding protein UgpC [Corynebacterium incognita]
MATVQFDAVSRIYTKGEKPAVDKLTLDIADGEFLVLVGPSGCGKSTSLRMLAGLEPTDDGAIRIGGKDVTGVNPSDRDVAMVFQNYALYPNMTVAENMGFALRNRGEKKDVIAAKVQEAAEILQLEDLLDRKPANLSGGQRQRVAMGRAIVRNPAVFCMDEPLSNLDAKLRVSTRAQISNLQRRLGTTTVYVTHDQTEAMTMGDRVAVLNGGVLQQVATPREIYSRPANLFVAGFIGSPAMNIYTVPVRDGAVVFGNVTVPVAGVDLAGAEKVTVGVRPEDLHRATDGKGLDVVVSHVEELGYESFAYCEPVGNADMTSSTHLTGLTGIRLTDRGGVDVEQQLTVAPDPAKLHLFDADTGDRLV